MIHSNGVQVGGRAALAGSLLIWTLMYPMPKTALAESDSGGRGWDARVEGTSSQGLTVRQGPSTDSPVQTIIPEGTIIHVVEGPRFDQDSHPWYRVSGYNRAGSTGWSAGDYLLGSPPASTNAS